MRVLKVLLSFARAYLFYPVMVGAFIWLYVNKAHWGFGLAIIIAILVLDPIWATLANSFYRAFKRNFKQ